MVLPFLSIKKKKCKAKSPPVTWNIYDTHSGIDSILTFYSFVLISRFIVDQEFKKESQFTLKVMADQNFYDSVRDQQMKYLGNKKQRSIWV